MHHTKISSLKGIRCEGERGENGTEWVRVNKTHENQIDEVIKFRACDEPSTGVHDIFGKENVVHTRIEISGQRQWQQPKNRHKRTAC